MLNKTKRIKDLERSVNVVLESYGILSERLFELENQKQDKKTDPAQINVEIKNIRVKFNDVGKSPLPPTQAEYRTLMNEFSKLNNRIDIIESHLLNT